MRNSFFDGLVESTNDFNVTTTKNHNRHNSLKVPALILDANGSMNFDASMEFRAMNGKAGTGGLQSTTVKKKIDIVLMSERS